MKKIHLYILCVTCLIGLETCEKPEIPEIPKTNTIKVNIAFNEILSSSGQKLFIDGANSAIYWTSGDQLRLVNANKDVTFSYSGAQQGVVYFNYTGDPMPVGSYIGVHPIGATVNTATNSVTYTGLSAYAIDSAALNAYITSNLLMYTPTPYIHGTDDTAFFSPAMTILEIPLKTNSGTLRIKSLTLTAVGSSNAFIKTGTLQGTSLTVTTTENTKTYNFSGTGLPIGTTSKTIKLLIWSNPNTTGLTSYTLGINTNTVNNATLKKVTKTTPFLNSKYYKFPDIIIPDSVVTPTIGSLYGGGYVFHIFTSGQPGYVAGETHGLVATPVLSNTYVWDANATQGTIVQTDSAIGTGASNTTKMINKGCAGAAKACKDYRGGGYSDWFLPSYFEMLALWTKLKNKNVFSPYNASHWTSTEKPPGSWQGADSQAAFIIHSTSGSLNQEQKNTSQYVIPVRAF